MSTIFVILVAAVLVWIAVIYNRLVSARNTVLLVHCPDTSDQLQTS